jgi:hypothetical protein
VVYGRDVTAADGNSLSSAEVSSNPLSSCSSFQPSCIGPENPVGNDVELISLHERAIPNNVITNLFDALPGYKFNFFYESGGQIRPAYVLLLASSVKGKLVASGAGYTIVPSKGHSNSSLSGAPGFSNGSSTTTPNRPSVPRGSYLVVSQSSTPNLTCPSTSTLRTARSEIKGLVAEVERAQAARVQRSWQKMLEERVSRRRENERLDNSGSRKSVVLNAPVRDVDGEESAATSESSENEDMSGWYYDVSQTTARSGIEETNGEMDTCEREQLWVEVFQLLGARASEVAGV